MDPSAADAADEQDTTDWEEPVEEEEEDANPECGEKEEDDTEDLGGGPSGEDAAADADDDDYTGWGEPEEEEEEDASTRVPHAKDDADDLGRVPSGEEADDADADADANESTDWAEPEEEEEEDASTRVPHAKDDADDLGRVPSGEEADDADADADANESTDWAEPEEEEEEDASTRVPHAKDDADDLGRVPSGEEADDADADADANESTDWAEPEEEEEDDANTRSGEKEEDDAEDSGERRSGEGGADDGDIASPNSADSNLILLPADPMKHRIASLLRRKKLILVLDLDHTLMNSVKLRDLSQEERDNGITRDDPSRELFRLILHPDPLPNLVKLRPFVREFLEEANTMFEMHVCTLAKRDYAEAVVRLLDPDGVYIGDRIISRNELPAPQPGEKHWTKNLDGIIGESLLAPSMVIILDDKERVWTDRPENLFEMAKYIYFAAEHRKKKYHPLEYAENRSLSELGHDESRDDGALAVALRVLRRVHDDFYTYSLLAGIFSNVKDLMEKMRLQLLRGCTVEFVGVLRRAHRTWKRAKQLGAEYAHIGGEEATHLVVGRPGTYEPQQLQQPGKFIVRQSWIDAAFFRWVRPDEEDFPVA
uniref:RNA polymerase II C-terminal domain phosphatase-like n=1 Tax=Leersia perrieri TaxID=77586 RepID=A0A0D9VM54_9ORYZ